MTNRPTLGGFIDAEVDRAFYETFYVTQKELASWRGWSRNCMTRLLAGQTNNGRALRLKRRKIAKRNDGGRRVERCRVRRAKPGRRG